MKKIIFSVLVLLFSFLTFAQVGIGTTTPKSQLDIAASSTSAPVVTDGLLIPRVTAFPSGVTFDQNGMLVFLTTAFGANKVGLYYYDFPSVSWKWMPTGNNANIWSYNTATSRIELPFLSNGTTVRPTGSQFQILDNGNTGLGTSTPATKLDVAGTINFATGLYYGGLSSPANVEITRAIPTSVNDFIDIGNFNIPAGAHNFRLYVTCNNTGFSVSKAYSVSVKYNQTNNVWYQLNPISNTGSFSGNDFELDIRVLNNFSFLRLRKTFGTIAGNVQIRVENLGSTTDLFLESTTAGTTVAPTIIFPNTTVSNPWAITGNSGTNATTNFVGTIDNVDFVTKTNDLERTRVTANGNVGIGNINPATKLDVAGNINTTSGLFYGGTSSPANLEIIRAIPTVVNDCIEIGNFNILHGAHNFRISVTSNTFNSSEAKTYIVSTKYNQTGNIWFQLNPISNTGIYLLDDFELDIRVFNSITSLRLRKKIGSIGGQAQIRIENLGSITDVFTQTSLTGSFAAPTQIFPNNTLINPWTITGNSGTNATTNFVGTSDNIDFVTRTNNLERMRITNSGNIGIGTASPAAKLDIVGGERITSANSVNAISENYVFLRNLANTATSYTEIGNFDVISKTNRNINLEVSIISSHSGGGISNKYLINGNFDDVNSVSWREVMPIITSGDRGGLIALDIAGSSITGSNNTIQLRIRTSTGLSQASVPVTIQIKSVNNPLLAELSGTGTDSTVLPLFRNSVLTQNLGRVGVGTSNPNPSAILDISSTNKGVLLPRMTQVERNLITKVAGLMIYQTDNTPGLRVCNGTNWMRYTETID